MGSTEQLNNSHRKLILFDSVSQRILFGAKYGAENKKSQLMARICCFFELG
jgi:hypothetical protein